MQWKFFSSLLLILIFIFFTAQNWERVTLKIFSYTLSTTLAFIIVLSLLIGFILGTIVSGIKQFKLQKEKKKLLDKIEKQNEELKYLRYLQIKDDE